MMARLHYLENRALLYHLSGTFPPPASAPIEVCNRVRRARATQTLRASAKMLDPQTLYNLDHHFNILKSTDCVER